MQDFKDMRIAVIGNGRWAQNHIRILKECGAFAGAYDIETNYKVVIQGNQFGQIDGVVIATDPVMHFPISEYALDLGVAVYCEKPIATQYWQLPELMKLKSNAVYQAGFQLLYNEAIVEARDQGVKHFVSRRLGGNYRNESVVQTLMIHDISVAAFLFGTAMGVDPYEVWGMRSEVNANLSFPDQTEPTRENIAILHARYGLPAFRQMDFIKRDGFIFTDAFDNHRDTDLVELSVHDWLRCIQKNSHSNRNYMGFAVNVQLIAFEIDKKIGIMDSVQRDEIAERNSQEGMKTVKSH